MLIVTLVPEAEPYLERGMCARCGYEFDRSG